MVDHRGEGNLAASTTESSGWSKSTSSTHLRCRDSVSASAFLSATMAWRSLLTCPTAARSAKPAAWTVVLMVGLFTSANAHIKSESFLTLTPLLSRRTWVRAESHSYLTSSSFDTLAIGLGAAILAHALRARQPRAKCYGHRPSQKRANWSTCFFLFSLSLSFQGMFAKITRWKVVMGPWH